jgi:hypothetical protein
VGSPKQRERSSLDTKRRTIAGHMDEGVEVLQQRSETDKHLKYVLKSSYSSSRKFSWRSIAFS